MFQPDLLAGRIALVTGGGTGLGRAMALRFAELGADVAVLGRSPGTIEAVAAEIRALGRKGAAVSADVRDAARVNAAVGEVEDALGPVTILVNNAAGNILCPSEDLSPNAFASVVGILVHGTFHCSQAVANRLIARGEGGTILNITTSYALSGTAFALPSAVGKGGIMVMTRSLAVEWAKYNIRVNAIAPGPIPTEGAWKKLVLTPAMERLAIERVPLHRFGEPRELADLGAYMVSDHAGYMTGECVALDGGEQWRGSGFNEMARLTRDEARAMGMGKPAKSGGAA